MKNSSRYTALAAVSMSLLVASCGLSPFGPGESGLSIFAHLGKAIQKPSQINDEQTSKEGAKETVTAAMYMTDRLAKSSPALDPWLVDRGIADSGNGVFCYWEEVNSKPSEEDADKKVTGRAEVKFKYNGTPDISTINAASITEILSFEMVGREYKSWSGVTDTVRVTIVFQDPAVKDFKPGLITAWGKNISESQSLGRGDTASFVLDSLDDAAHVQYGEGHFYDAHTGRNNDGDSKSFDFTMQVIHKNSLDESKPYERYQDNEGIINFYLDRAVGEDLYFTVHFKPLYKRDGTIQKGGPDGPVLVEFEYDEKKRTGSATYYNADGDVIDTENL
ncbi:MAG: hypothetical protein JW768_14675 [Chitinispirillaceae bacterium]|nr:hypothetical protein [Chitinispirillaceae bacterium]